MGFINALNSLNTPWIAIIVIGLGMVFEVVCKVYGLNSDGASTVIGAGVGLLTGQALSKSSTTAEPMPAPKNGLSSATNPAQS